MRFSLTSPDGDEGYPGTVEVFVTYFLSFNSEYVPELSIEYAATTSKPTPINLTNHTYFNLSGNCSRNILQQKLLLNCDRYLPVSASQIPTGELASVEGTPFDFTKNATSYGKILGDAIPVIDGGGRPGVDHCFVINGAVESYSASSLHASPLRLVGYLTDEVSGRQLTVKSTCPGAQIYTANWLSTDPIDHPYTQYNGVCLETQHFPDSINQPAFPSCLLRPENQYHQKTVLTFSIIL